MPRIKTAVSAASAMTMTAMTTTLAALDVADRFRPLGDWILVKRDDPQSKSRSGILFLPESAQVPPDRGTVLAAGPGRYNEFNVFVPVAVEAGDRVIFGTFAGHEMVVDGVKVIIMREGEISGTLDGE